MERNDEEQLWRKQRPVDDTSPQNQASACDSGTCALQGISHNHAGETMFLQQCLILLLWPQFGYERRLEILLEYIASVPVSV